MASTSCTGTRPDPTWFAIFDVSRDGKRLIVSGWVQVFSLMEGRFSLHGLFWPRRQASF